MSQSINILLASAATLGLLHTVIGPDHYLPFIVLGRAEGWTLRKTMFWTFVCGVGHVASSIVLGFVGVALGWALSSMTRFEAVRGNLAAWALIGFGFIYFVWGLWRAWKGHSHVHAHADGSLHDHPHPHDRVVDGGHGHERAQHDEAAHVARHRRTLWVLFTIFVLGPCEPLIPLLMAPAARHDMLGVAAVAGLFGGITVGMMMVMVALGTLGVRLIRIEALERHAHALAGFAIFVSGLLIQLLGV
jgi:nickel/cobalt transporter (NicO) family protein